MATGTNDGILLRASSLDVHERKRIRPDQSPTICTKCEAAIFTSINIHCSNCKRPFCSKCTGINEALLQLMTEAENNGITWTCTSCKSTAPTLDNISSTLHHMCLQNDQRINSIEGRVSHLENNTKEIVSEEITNNKQELVGLMREDIVAIVDERNRELDDRRSKESNIILFNVPEFTGDIATLKAKDTTFVQELAHTLLAEPLKIVVQDRLGKTPTPGKKRPYLLYWKAKVRGIC